MLRAGALDNFKKGKPQLLGFKKPTNWVKVDEIITENAKIATPFDRYLCIFLANRSLLANFSLLL